MASIEWKKEFHDELIKLFGTTPKKIKVLEHLLPLNVGKLYQQVEGKGKYGCLPEMYRSSRCNIGALSAQSFCDRFIPAANIVMDDGNTLLSDEELNMMVVLRINREFMLWAREEYANLDHGEFKTSEIPEKEIE